MSAFDSVFRSANTANLAQLETELEAMGKNLGINATGASDSTTSSKTALSGSITVASDEILEVLAIASFSANSATIAAAWKLVVNSVQVDIAEMYALPNIATGQGVVAIVHAYVYDISGSIPCRTDMLITSGSGTLYAKNLSLKATTMKRR